MSRSTHLAAAVAAVAALALPGTASALPTCNYNAAIDTVVLRLDAPAPNGAYTLSRAGAGIVVRNGLPGAAPTACGAGTVFNTDQIEVVGTALADRFVVDLSTGPFAPGVTPEPGGLPEIEIDVDLRGPGNRDEFEVRGSDFNDDIAGGRLGADLAVALNPDNDADITVDGRLRVVRFYGFLGNDTIGVGGTQLGIAPWPGRAQMFGGQGDDFLAGGNGRDLLRGDSGTDIYRAGAGIDRLFAQDGNAESVDTGTGADWVQADPTDVVS